MSKILSRTINSSSLMKKLGMDLAKKIRKSQIILLQGNLGTGKTTFIQGLAFGFGIQEKIKSPTFSILKVYQIKNKRFLKRFYHLDCYRVKEKKDLFSLGLKEILEDQESIIAIEWPDKILSYLPKKRITVKIELEKIKTTRKVSISIKDK